jgi:hypothetical protein
VTRHRRLRLAPSITSAPGANDGVDKIIRALVPRRIAGDKNRARLPRVDLGQLQIAVGRERLEFALCLLDDSGRLAGRPLFELLGWSTEHPLKQSLGRGYIALQPAKDGGLSLDKRMRLGLPPGLQRYCGLRSGDKVLLVAAPEHRMLIVHPMANLAHMTRTFHAEQLQQNVRRGVAGLAD